MGISIGILWYTTSKNKLIPLCYLALGASLLLGTGSRNVAIIILLCFLMVLLPEKVYKNPYVFFMLCAIPLIYTIFAKDILDFAFSNERIAELLYDYTEQFSEKAWDIAERVAFLTRVDSIISSRGFFENIFGEGSLQGHCHNLFYQSVLLYGYAGAALIYAWYIRVLWMGYCLIKENGDSFALGCVIIMLGHFWLQGADVYMVGIEACAVVPQVIMGLIMQRYRVNKNKLMARRGTV
jgi:O-antigen ligase